MGISIDPVVRGALVAFVGSVITTLIMIKSNNKNLKKEIEKINNM